MDCGETIALPPGHAALRPGDHPCAVHENEEELRAFLSAYVAGGIARDEKILAAVDAASAEAVLDDLRGRGIGPEPLRDRGQIRFLDPVALFLPDGTFDPGRMADFLREESDRAVREGYAALRAVVDMIGALHGLPGVDRLVECETKLDALLPGRRLLACCLYDARKFPAPYLLKILPMHPLVFVGGEVLENIYYAPPAEDPGGDGAHRTLRRWLRHLRERSRAEAEIRRHRDDLERLAGRRTEELRAGEASVRALVNASPDAAILIDRRGTVLEINEETARRLGWPPDALKGRCVYDFFPPGVAETRREKTEEVIRTGRPARHEDVRQGRVIESHLYPVRGDRGEVIGVAVFGIDVTERKGAEALLAEIADFVSVRTGLDYFRSLVEFLGRKFDVDYSLVGRREDDGRTLRTLVLGVRGKVAGNIVYDVRGTPCETVIEKGFLCVPRDVVRRYPTPRLLVEMGAESYVGLPLFGSNGGPLGVIALVGCRPLEEKHVETLRSVLKVVSVRAAAEIERMRAEETLRESEKTLRALIETTDTGYVIIDGEGRVLDANAEYARLAGYDAPERILGKKVTEWTSERDRERNADEIRKCLERGGVRNLEIEYASGEGRTTPIEINAAVLQTADGTRIVTLCRDITERKQAERALRESEERYRTIFSSGGDAFLVFDLAGRILDANPKACELYGYGHDELTRLSGSDIVDPSCGHTFEAFRRTGRGEWFRVESMDVRKGGERFPVDVHGTRVRYGGADRLLAIIRDITERIRLEATLRASLREKEILLREIHHRVKNNLQVVTSLLALQERSVLDPAAAAALAESRNRIRSIALVHEKLYRAGDLAGVDFEGYVRRLFTSLLQTYGIPSEKVRLRTDIEGVRLEISTAIPCALILNELLVNVLKHAYPGETSGEVVVALRRDEAKWTLRVSDRGRGLPEGFDPAHLQSLGLRIVSLLAFQLGGTMTMSGEGGTTVTVAFADPGYAGGRGKEGGGA